MARQQPTSDPLASQALDDPFDAAVGAAGLEEVAPEPPRGRPPSREASSRAAYERITPQEFQPNKILAAPRLLDPGKHFRWVREKILGQPDELAIQSAIADGYRPVRIEDLEPDDRYRMTAELLSADGSKTGVVRYGGLIGMVFDEGLQRQRRVSAQREVDQNTASAKAVFGVQQQVNGGRGGLPVVHEDRGSRVEIGAAVDSLGAM